MRLVDRVLRIKDAPFVVGMLFAAAAWCVSHIVDRLLERPIVAFDVRDATDLEIRTCFPENADKIGHAIDLENLSTVALRTFEVYVTLGPPAGSPNEKLISRLCGVNTGFTVSDGIDRSDRAPQRVRKSEIDELLPHATASIVVVSSASDDEVSVMAKSAGATAGDRATFEFRRVGFTTFVLQNESVIILALLLVCVALGTSSLLHKSNRARHA